jgi:hypothetical protein
MPAPISNLVPPVQHAYPRVSLALLICMQVEVFGMSCLHTVFIISIGVLEPSKSASVPVKTSLILLMSPCCCSANVLTSTADGTWVSQTSEDPHLSLAIATTFGNSHQSQCPTVCQQAPARVLAAIHAPHILLNKGYSNAHVLYIRRPILCWPESQ